MTNFIHKEILVVSGFWGEISTSSKLAHIHSFVVCFLKVEISLAFLSKNGQDAEHLSRINKGRETRRRRRRRHHSRLSIRLI